jgi:hypothetical protein
LLALCSSRLCCRLLLCEQRALSRSSAGSNWAAGGHALRQDHCTRTPWPPPISSTYTTTALPLYPACLRPLPARPRPLNAAAVEPCCCGSQAAPEPADRASAAGGSGCVARRRKTTDVIVTGVSCCCCCSSSPG